MKSRIAFVFGILAIAVLPACTALGDLFTVTVDADFGATISVSVNEEPGTPPYAFEKETSFNPADEEALKDYLDNIKDFDVKTITATIASLSKPFTLTDGAFTISGNGETVTWSLDPIDVVADYALDVSNANGEYEKVRTILNGLSEVTMTLAGKSSEPAVDFSVKVDLDTEVKAGI